MLKLTPLVILIFAGCAVATLPSLPTLLGTSNLIWEGGSMDFSTPIIKNMFTHSKHYIPKNMIVTKFVTHLDTIIALAPRFKSGNPSSIISYKTSSKMVEPQFTAYPDLNFHEIGNCDAIQNAIDMYLDKNGLLWVLDSGIINTMEQPKKTCSPKVVCISVITGQMIRQIDLSDYVEPESVLHNVVADYDITGNAFIYVSDAGCGKVFVYDITKSSGFKLEFPKEVINKRSANEPLFLILTKELTGETVLYLTYMNSPCIFSIKTSYLKKGKSEGKISRVATKYAPMMFLGTDSGSKLYYRYKTEQIIYAWDTTTPFKPDALTPVYESDECFAPTCVSFDLLRGAVKVLESNYQDYVSGNCGVGVLHQIVKI